MNLGPGPSMRNHKEQTKGTGMLSKGIRTFQLFFKEVVIDEFSICQGSREGEDKGWFCCKLLVENRAGSAVIGKRFLICLSALLMSAVTTTFVVLVGPMVLVCVE